MSKKEKKERLFNDLTLPWDIAQLCLFLPSSSIERCSQVFWNSTPCIHYTDPRRSWNPTILSFKNGNLQLINVIVFIGTMFQATVRDRLNCSYKGTLFACLETLKHEEFDKKQKTGKNYTHLHWKYATILRQVLENRFLLLFD